MKGTFGIKETITPVLSLFAASGTLVCCALPALFVSLGMGATLAGIVSTIPGLVWLSKYKLWVFLISGILIAISGLLQWNARKLACPLDPQKAQACMKLRKFSWYVWGIATISYGIGFFFAFVAPRILFND